MTGTAKRKAEEHCSDERSIPANSMSPFVGTKQTAEGQPWLSASRWYGGHRQVHCCHGYEYTPALVPNLTTA